MRRTIAALCVLALASLSQAQTTAPAATQPGEASVKIITATVNRYGPELQKKFRNRYGSDGNAGVRMQLMLTLPGQQMLPLTQQAINIDTFIDDTYQNLLGNQREYYGGGQLQLSDDGGTLLFPVQAGKPPADDAERVFVRGSVTARVGRGEQKTAGAKVKLKVSENFTAGPYKGQVRSLNDNGANQMSVSMTLTGGEGTSIRNVRVTSPSGTMLQERGVPSNDGYTDRPTVSVNLSIPSGNEEVMVEFSYFEKLDTIKIPFEAQVDIGHAKSGPIEVGAPAKAPGTDRRRAWPPPADERIDLPTRRTGFAPATQPTGNPNQPLAIKPVVDLFSLTLGKPAPDEVAAATWNAKPSSTFRPRGFTLARLLLTVPDAVILSITANDLSLTRFGDDKTPNVEAGINSIFVNNSSRTNIAMMSREGQQALVTLPIDAAITPGATKANIAGSVKAAVGRGEKILTTEPVELKAGTKLTAGPYELLVSNVYQSPPQSAEGGYDAGFAVTVTVKGPIRQLRTISLPGSSNYGAPMNYGVTYDQGEQTQTNIQLNLQKLPTENQPITLRYFEKVETVTLPFDLSTTLGL